MSFRIRALPATEFAALFDLDDEALAARHGRRVVVDCSPGFPCRVSLADAEVGETVLLVNFTHHDVATPYRASHAIFVREGAERATLAQGEVPAALARRLLSFRAFDAKGDMVAAEVADGRDFSDAVRRLFADPGVEFLHAHNAGPGCYACRVDRF
ncbi:MAG: DUF1203 domain-containing protein [Alphaproteobacteria bacterium]|nr:DUF1203 domain-containing protein [Alphaproteobacteria bacterium]